MGYQTLYNSRKFLNSDNSPSTGSICCYDGAVKFNTMKSREKVMFVEIADCHQKARLHKSGDDTNKDFIDKVKLLRDELNSFIEHLEKQYLK